jgi:hypothetical protein
MPEERDPPGAAANPVIEVQIISAPWCRRCDRIKPEVASHVAVAGARLVNIQMEDLEEAEQAAITSLPTVRMRPTPTVGWMIYNAHTLDHWKEDLTQLTLKNMVTVTDF